jgi:hypothetical protein
MFRGYWRYVFAIVAGLSVSGSIYVLESLYDAGKQQHTSYHYQPASHPSRLLLVPGKTEPQPYQPNCYNPQDDKNADLCAQWAAVDQVGESNRLTSINLSLGILTLIFTVGSAILLVWTLIETRETARRELRAYVFPESVGISVLTNQPDKSHNGRISGTIIIKNSGQTPAYQLEHWGEVALGLVSEEDALQVVNDGYAPIQNVIPPGGMLHKHRRMERGPSPDEIIGLNKGIFAIYMFGRIDYVDAFDRKRFTNYRFAYSGWPLPELAMMNFALRGNEAD